MRGQLRYAVRAGDTWTITTVVKQKGQVASKSPLHGFGMATFAVSPDGKEAVVAGLMQSWETDSIYNTESKPATVETVSLPITLSLP